MQQPLPWTISPWPHNLSQQASGNPGAVQNDYSAACFAQYGLPVDSTGQYAAMYKPFHLIGMELGISILSAALRHEPTGHSRQFRGDAVATAKRNLAPGEMLDGEGGYTVWGKLMPATRSVKARALPIGLAHGVKVTKPIKVGEIISRDAVGALPDNPALRLRLETEAIDPPPLKWSDLKYVLWHQGGSEHAKEETHA